MPEILEAIEVDRSKTGFQAAAVVADPRNGEILALVGDRNPRLNGFNRAIDAIRPIGSVIKPFVYAYALSQPERYSLVSRLNDRKIEWTDPKGVVWEPKNYDGKEYGSVTILEALTRSLNLSVIALGFELGLKQIREYLVSLGVESKFTAVPSMLLGSVEMSPLQLTELYTPLANDGFRVPLQSIKNVSTKTQQKITRYGLEMRKVMEVETAHLVRHALMRVASIGTARSLKTSLPKAQPLAGKTGTSNDNRDSWFVGFGGDKLGVTWVGRDDNSGTGLTGGSGALPLWAAIMSGTIVKPLSTNYSSKINISNIELLSSSMIPASCPNGELVPIHEESWIRQSKGCDSALERGRFAPVPFQKNK
ncbi:MAG TPA: penicillin-binding protein 1B, partial [Dehalococcoidia bacterium]|nr:penicillin-binding protein 1B [Dehalococcoidia bacterium]